MKLFEKKIGVAMVALVLAVFCGFLSINPAFAMPSRDSVPPPNQPANIAAKNVIKIDPAKVVVPEILPGGFLPEFPHPLIPGTTMEEVTDLPDFVSLDFRVESGFDAIGMYKIATFTGKATPGKRDGFLVEFESGAYLNQMPGGEKSYLFFRNGQRISIPSYPHTLRILPAAKGIFSVWDESCRCSVLKEGYVVGKAYEEVMNGGNGYMLHSMEIAPPPDDMSRITVPWSSILRTPKMLAKENPKRPHQIYPMIAPSPLTAGEGFWVQAWIHNPGDYSSLFDGLFLSYQDQSNMEFGSVEGNVGSDAIGIGISNFILTLPDGDFRAWIPYFPGGNSYNSLWVRAWVKDRTPGQERYIVAPPALNRIY